MNTINDLTGKKFGKLVVIERVDDYVSPQGVHKTRWLCQCECGKQCVARSNYLSNGHTTSCGCAKSERKENLMERICPFNNYVNCDNVKHCPKCGWNPAVHERRIESLKGGNKNDRSEHNNEACEAHPGE